MLVLVLVFVCLCVCVFVCLLVCVDSSDCGGANVLTAEVRTCSRLRCERAHASRVSVPSESRNCDFPTSNTSNSLTNLVFVFFRLSSERSTCIL